MTIPLAYERFESVFLLMFIAPAASTISMTQESAALSEKLTTGVSISAMLTSPPDLDDSEEPALLFRLESLEESCIDDTGECELEKCEPLAVARMVGCLQVDLLGAEELELTTISVMRPSGYSREPKPPSTASVIVASRSNMRTGESY